MFPFFEIEDKHKNLGFVRPVDRQKRKVPYELRLRAQKILDFAGVKSTASPYIAIVVSSSTNLEYSVNIQHQTCECLAFHYRKLCKHIIAAESFIRNAPINLRYRGSNNGGRAAQYKARNHGKGEFKRFGNVPVRKRTGPKRKTRISLVK